MFKYSKYICTFLLVVALFVFGASVVLAEGGFTTSCQNIQFNFFTGRGGFSPLTADCKTNAGEIHSGSTNFVDLNTNITNNDGTLAWQNDGGFANSVNNCVIDVSDITILSCDATKGDGSVVNSSITLDEKIANLDGNLTVTDVQVVLNDEKVGLIYDKTDTDLAKTAEKAKKGKGITSVKEAVDAAKDLTGDGKLETLILAGHGASGTIGLGSGTAEEYQKGKELRIDKLDDVSDDLNSLKESLEKDSYVILSSCSTGKEPNGLNFVKQLSDKLSDSYIFANIECVGLTDDNNFRKNSICTVEGNKQWQQKSVVAAKKNEEVKVDRDIYKKLIRRICVSKN